MLGQILSLMSSSALLLLCCVFALFGSVDLISFPNRIVCFTFHTHRTRWLPTFKFLRCRSRFQIQIVIHGQAALFILTPMSLHTPSSRSCHCSVVGHFCSLECRWSKVTFTFCCDAEGDSCKFQELQSFINTCWNIMKFKCVQCCY